MTSLRIMLTGVDVKEISDPSLVSTQSEKVHELNYSN